MTYVAIAAIFVLIYVRWTVSTGKNMLVIHPDECIDCGVCEPECPVDAVGPRKGAS